LALGLALVWVLGLVLALGLALELGGLLEQELVAQLLSECLKEKPLHPEYNEHHI
jgi:hypothetical protein